MILFALDPWWNDFYTAGGFWVGVVSLVVGVIAFVIAIVQLREARDAALASKDAAEAARDAANKTLAESKDAYERFVGAFASRLFSELEQSLGAKDWKLAFVRALDVAELFATLPLTGNEATDAAGSAIVTGLRDLASDLTKAADKKATKLTPLVAGKWKALQQLLHARLDQLRKPFREVERG